MEARITPNKTVYFVLAFKQITDRLDQLKRTSLIFLELWRTTEPYRCLNSAKKFTEEALQRAEFIGFL